MFRYKYARPSVAVSVIIRRGNEILLGKRQPTAEAYPSTWCIPGGFLDAKIDEADYQSVVFDGHGNMTVNPPVDPREGETTEQTGVREVFEETGLVIDPNDLRIVGVYSHPDIDPRCHVVHVVYYINLTGEQVASPGDDLAELEWFSANRQSTAKNSIPELMAFNHLEIILDYYMKVVYL